MCLILQCLIVEAWRLRIQCAFPIKYYFKMERKQNLDNLVYYKTFLEFIFKS